MHESQTLVTSEPHLVTPSGSTASEWFDTLRELGERNCLPYEWNAVGLWARDDGRTSLDRAGTFRELRFPSDDGLRLVSTVRGEGHPSDLLKLLQRVDALERITPRNLVLADEPEVLLRVSDSRYADYIYDLGEQVALEGKRFARRRTYLRSLARREACYDEVDLDLSEAITQASIRDVNTRWVNERDPDPLIAVESAALNRLLEASGALPVTARGITCNDDLVAFGIFDVNGRFATAHFVKSTRDSAVTASMWHAIFRAAFEFGAQTMNAGYDGGAAGLRFAKSNLVPHEVRTKETWTLDL